MRVPIDDRVRRWFDQARIDLDLAEEVGDRYAHQACLHAQRAADKGLKAVLTRLSGDAVPTHELERLLVACDALGKGPGDDVRTRARSLDKFYIPTRYPDALASARSVLAWCERAIAVARAADPDPP